MANKGQMILSILAPKGDGTEETISTTFQVAAVTRPLWSVSKICDAGYRALFTKKDAKVLGENGKTVCVFEREGGLYVARMKLRNPKHPGFARQGSR